jgi:glycerol-3-phosphate dehydrogenase
LETETQGYYVDHNKFRFKELHIVSPSLGQLDVIIIGGASAGLSAALYANRQGLSTLFLQMT